MSRLRLTPGTLLGLPTILALLFLPGCVGRNSRIARTEIQDLENRIYELQKRNAESQVEIEELREQEKSTAATAQPGGPEPESEAFGPGAAPGEEATVPGSTIDAGSEGPSRAAEPSVAQAASLPIPSPAEGPAPAPPPAKGDDRLYVEGYSQFNSGDYASARQKFEEFLSRSPQSDLADDAQYWMGECYFSAKDYRRAILEFRKVVDQYPFGNRVPHAFLKVGLSYLALGERDRALENLETVVEAFPKSDVAPVARATLDEIQAGASR